MTAPTPTEPAVRAALSRARILDAADDLLASGQTLSMRGIADRLDVTAMALYRWFANKDGLLDALTDRIAAVPAAVPADPSPVGPWAERTLGFAIEIRRGLLAHLPLLQIDGAARRLAANVYRSADEGLGLMLELGYQDEAAVEAYRVLFWSVLSHCLVIDATDAMPAISSPDSLTNQVIVATGADLDDLPTLASLLPRFAPVDPDAFFAQTMRVLIAGLEIGAPGQDAHRLT